ASGSKLTVSGNNLGATSAETAKLQVGFAGHGTLAVGNGADILIDGHDDLRPTLVIGESRLSQGTMTISGSGSTVILAGTNSTAAGGGMLIVGRNSGSQGTLTITDSAQVTNRPGSVNS